MDREENGDSYSNAESRIPIERRNENTFDDSHTRRLLAILNGIAPLPLPSFARPYFDIPSEFAQATFVISNRLPPSDPLSAFAIGGTSSPSTSASTSASTSVSTSVSRPATSTSVSRPAVSGSSSSSSSSSSSRSSSSAQDIYNHYVYAGTPYTPRRLNFVPRRLNFTDSVLSIGLDRDNTSNTSSNDPSNARLIKHKDRISAIRYSDPPLYDHFKILYLQEYLKSHQSNSTDYYLIGLNANTVTPINVNIDLNEKVFDLLQNTAMNGIPMDIETEISDSDSSSDEGDKGDKGDEGDEGDESDASTDDIGINEPIYVYGEQVQEKKKSIYPPEFGLGSVSWDYRCRPINHPTKPEERIVDNECAYRETSELNLDLSVKSINDLRIRSSISPPQELYGKKGYTTHAGNIQDPNNAQLKRHSKNKRGYQAWKTNNVVISDQPNAFVSIQTDFTFQTRNKDTTVYLLVIPHHTECGVGMPYFVKLSTVKFRLAFLLYLPHPTIFQSNQVIGKFYIVTDCLGDFNLCKLFHEYAVYNREFTIGSTGLDTYYQLKLKPGSNIFTTPFTIHKEIQTKPSLSMFTIASPKIYPNSGEHHFLKTQVFSTNLSEPLKIEMINRTDSDIIIKEGKQIAQLVGFVWCPDNNIATPAPEANHKHPYKNIDNNEIIEDPKVKVIKYYRCPYNVEKDKKCFLPIKTPERAYVIQQKDLYERKINAKILGNQYPSFTSDLVLLIDVAQTRKDVYGLRNGSLCNYERP